MGGSMARLARWSGLVGCLIGLSALAGCGTKSRPSGTEAPADAPEAVAKGAPGKTAGETAKRKPSISADPNPVPAGSEKFGKTKVTWDTGDGSVGEVYVSTNGGEEKLFAGNRPKGSLDAAWIGKAEYVFRLYAGKERSSPLATVKVTRNKD